MLPYYGNYSLSRGAAVTRAIVVVHGINRNAQDYFGSIERAATNIGVAETTIIIAPRFQIEQDEREDHDAYWTDSGRNSWKDGGGALAPAGLSSFKVMDEVLTALADNDRFPGLTRITLVGHSAGGQFTQRYAAAGRAPDTLRGVTIVYVTANPSSYLYLNSYRPIGEKLLESCPGYNDYKYGLDRRNEYCSILNDERIRHQYIGRLVTYLLGSADVDQDDDLETVCAANVQGRNRFERGRFYYSALRTFFPSAQHDMVIVPEVGHDHDAMFNSTQGKTAIFRDSEPADPDQTGYRAWWVEPVETPSSDERDPYGRAGHQLRW
jgi:pimeloyl-ACP methyl ester carboxylesterase